jgi:N-acetylmuramoyl-L-alanine amidase
MSIEEKANGILIKLYSKKELRKFTSGISDNTLYLTIMGVGVDIERISKARPKGLIKKIDVKKLAQSYQISFSLNEGYSTSETYFDKNKKELVITIHNRYIENIKNTDLKGSKIDVIVIDAGHGGRDPGAIGINGLKEKDINLSVALELGALLKAEYPEVKIVYTRTTDEYIDLYKRGKIANEAEGKLFISIHCNSSKNKDLTGSEVYFLGISRTAEAIAIAEKENSVIAYEEDNERYKELTNENFILATMAHAAYTKFSERFAEIINEKFGNDLPYPARGVRQAGFYVLVGASMPSVLLEIGYLSNKFDADYLRSYTNRKTIARSIFESIKIFKEEYEKETLGQK